jgi:2-dehydropantoate 2-reductase
MKLLIWGAGAVGGTIGAYLSRAGHEITLVDTAEDHVQAMQEHGLQITGPIDQFKVHVHAATPAALQGQFDQVLLCVKAQHTREAATMLLPHLSASGYVASFQNGLNELTLTEIVGRERTIGAFINFGADYIEPGVIQRGNRAAVVIGELDGQITPRLALLHQALLDFDDRAIMTENIWGYLWGKMTYGVMLFATALTPDSIADIFENEQFHSVMIGLAHEVLAVARSQGVHPEGFDGFDPKAFDPDNMLDQAIESLQALGKFNRGSAKSHSGIYRDIAIRKRKTEADDQLGPIISLAAQAGLPTPMTQQVKDMINQIERGQREQTLQNLNALRNP